MQNKNKASIKKTSLKARAVAYLSRREHSRLELERKLSPYANSSEELLNVLDYLQEHNWQCDNRFAQSLISRRINTHGWERISYELAQKGVSDQIIQSLKDELSNNEHNAAMLVWEKKFGHKAKNQKEYARQYRFLISRGFKYDIVRKVIGDLPV